MQEYMADSRSVNVRREIAHLDATIEKLEEARQLMITLSETTAKLVAMGYTRRQVRQMFDYETQPNRY